VTRRRANLEDGAQLLREEPARQLFDRGGRLQPVRVAGDAVGVNRDADAPGERHLAQRDEEAAVRTIVVGQHEARFAQVGERRIQPAERARIVDVRSLVARLAEDLRQRRRAETRAASREVHQHQGGRALVGPELRRECRAHVVARRERRDDQRQRADDLARVAVCCHVVRIDIESLPTGILTPSAGTGRAPPRARCRTARRPRPARPRPPSSCRELDERQGPDGAAARFVSASPTAIRPDAGASMTASGVRSPIAKRLPRVPIKRQQRRRAIGDRHLPGSDALVARAEPADRAVADRDEERLVGHGWRTQDAAHRLVQREAGGIERAQREPAARVRARHPRRLAEQGRQIHVDRVVPKSGSRTSRR